VGLDAILEGDLGVVKDLFKTYLLGCFELFGKNRPTSSSVDDITTRELKVATAPILDAMDLTGYGRVFADFHDLPDIWSSMKKSWDELSISLGQVPNPKALHAILGLAEAPMELPYRGVVRTRWLMKVSPVLKKRAILAL
jgi:hypothetical protein